MLQAMKHLFSSIMLLALLSACTSSTQRLQKERQAAIAARQSGDTYTFKVWPGAEVSHAVRLSGAPEADCMLGPDFTVHYFTWPQRGSLAIYHGGHPQDETDKPTGKLTARFGSKTARWSLFQKAEGFRATAYVTELDQDGEPSYTWHLMVHGQTEKEVRAIIAQLSTFHEVR